MSENKLEALKKVKNEIEKLYEKAVLRAEKERDKHKEWFVIIGDEKYYDEIDIQEAYGCGVLSTAQYDRYVNKLRKKKDKSDKLVDSSLAHICKIYLNILSSLDLEIRSVEYDLLPEDTKYAIARADEEELDNQDRRMREEAKKRIAQEKERHEKIMQRIEKKRENVMEVGSMDEMKIEKLYKLMEKAKREHDMEAAAVLRRAIFYLENYPKG